MKEFAAKNITISHNKDEQRIYLKEPAFITEDELKNTKKKKTND